MGQYLDPISVEVTATDGIDKDTFIGFDGALPTAGERVLGVCNFGTPKGDLAPVVAVGKINVTAKGAIAVGAEIEATALGEALTKASGVVVAVALTASAQDGDLISVLLK